MGVSRLDLSFGRDANGRLTGVTDNISSGRGATYGYTDAGRLNAATGPWGTDAYTYDGAGNRTDFARTLGGTTTHATPILAGASNRVTEIHDGTGATVRSFTWRAGGDLAQDAQGVSAVYSYNARKRVIDVTTAGVDTAQYGYDFKGQRVWKAYLPGSVTTHYVYDEAGHLLAEHDGVSGAVLREYVWLDDLPVAMIDSTGSSPAIYYIHAGQLDEPQMMAAAHKPCEQHRLAECRAPPPYGQGGMAQEDVVNFMRGFLRSYASAWHFLAALPLLGIAIVGVEGLQHVVEWRAGMFVNTANAHHAANDIGRMLLGTLKVLWLNVVGFWVFRFVVSRSATVTMRPGPEAVRRYAQVMVYVATLGALTLWPPVLAPAALQRPLSFVLLAVMLLTFPLGAALTPWIVGAALGDPRATVGFSMRRARGSIWWGVALSLATVFPLMIIHYALNLGAIGRASPVAALMLGADTIVVGFLGVATATSQQVVAERMAARVDDHLIVAS